jgi:hypothetical protein
MPREFFDKAAIKFEVKFIGLTAVNAFWRRLIL